MNLLICKGCESHEFVIFTGKWTEISFMPRLVAPLGVLCAKCGHEFPIQIFWTDEPKDNLTS